MSDPKQPTAAEQLRARTGQRTDGTVPNGYPRWWREAQEEFSAETPPKKETPKP